MNDTISRQAAINKFEPWLKVKGYSDGELNMLKAVLYELTVMPSAQPEPEERKAESTQNVPNDELISRKAAIEAVINRDANSGIDSAEVLKDLPSVQIKRKNGKWIYNSPVTMKCDQCGFVIKDWDWHRFKFCPNCDCDMRGEQE